VPDEDPLARLRAICMALPEVEERLSHAEPTWFVRGKKSFVMYCNYHHGLRLGFWAAAPDGALEVLGDVKRDQFYKPPYVGTRGWIGVNLDVVVDWDEIAVLVEDAYRCVAPNTLIRVLDAVAVSDAGYLP
jgi:hypothetical protein